MARAMARACLVSVVSRVALGRVSSHRERARANEQHSTHARCHSSDPGERASSDGGGRAARAAAAAYSKPDPLQAVGARRLRCRLDHPGQCFHHGVHGDLRLSIKGRPRGRACPPYTEYFPGSLSHVANPPTPPARRTRPLRAGSSAYCQIATYLSAAHASQIPHITRAHRRACGGHVACTRRGHRAANPAHFPPQQRLQPMRKLHHCKNGDYVGGLACSLT